jgi:hypothetical protein
MIQPARILLITALALAACSGNSDEKKSDETADKIAAVKVRRPMDPGALLVQSPSSKDTPSEQASATVNARLAHQDHIYVSVPLPIQLSDWELVGSRIQVVGASSHGLAAPVVGGMAEADGSDRIGAPSRLVVRFVGSAPADFTLSLTVVPLYGELASRVVSIKVDNTSKAMADKELMRLFFEGLSAQAAASTTHPFYMFVAQRAKLLGEQGGLSAAMREDQRQQRQRRGEIGETMALYTGLNAVEESLQYDRGLLLRGEGKAERTVALSSLEGVKLAAHPWAKLIAALPTKPVMEPMAALVPADMAYLHFHDLRELSRLSGELDSWLTPLVRIAEGRAEDAELVARYEDQLALRKTKLSEQLGHVATQGVALVTSDPFLREGSDLSVLFHVRNKAVLDGALDKLLAERVAERPDATTSTYALGAHTVTHTRTPDGLIERHRLELGEHVIVSNSKAALEQIIAAKEGKQPSLATSGDFQYMRARYPFDVKQEAGFLFIGDAFVADAIGPRAKILSGRRMQGIADVRALNYAALLFGWMEGRQPTSLDEVVKEGLLDPSELMQGDAKLSWTPAGGAYSPSWGTPRVQRPLIDATLDKVTPAEAEAYKRFVTTYQQYWRGFIDPIGVRIQRSEDGAKLAFDGRMLPIIDSSDYNNLIEMTGTRTFVPGQALGAAQWTFALGDDARLRREMNQALRSGAGSAELTIDWVGDWIAVGAADRGILWDIFLFSEARYEERETVREQAKKKHIDELFLLARLPVYLMVHVKSPAILAGVLTALRKEVEQAAPGMVVWLPGATYREIATVTIGENLLQTGRVGLPIQLHYATVKGVFVASLDRAVMEQAIDMILDDRGPGLSDPASPSPAATQSEIAVRPWPEKSWLLRTALGSLELDARRGFTRSLGYWEILARGLGHAPTDAEALAHMGRSLAKPHGQPLTAGQDGDATHAIYGSLVKAMWPALPVAGSPVTAAVEAMRALRMDLSFEGEGEDRGIHARVEVELKR